MKVTDRRTNVDFVHCIQDVVDVHYPEADKVMLVNDRLNTHKPAAQYETFAPEEARRIIEKLEWHSTPKHGSWLDMAGIELSILQRQSLDPASRIKRLSSAKSRRGSMSAINTQ